MLTCVNQMNERHACSARSVGLKQTQAGKSFLRRPSSTFRRRSRRESSSAWLASFNAAAMTCCAFEMLRNTCLRTLQQTSIETRDKPHPQHVEAPKHPTGMPPLGHVPLARLLRDSARRGAAPCGRVTVHRAHLRAKSSSVVDSCRLDLSYSLQTCT